MMSEQSEKRLFTAIGVAIEPAAPARVPSSPDAAYPSARAEASDEVDAVIATAPAHGSFSDFYGSRLRRDAMKSLIVGSGCLSSRLQADAALVAGLSYVGAAVAAALAATSQSTLVREAVIAAWTGSACGLLGVLGAVLVRHAIKAGGVERNQRTKD
jgi:hypothetical protein